ncbi:MAG TPA: hypothetical protein VI197_25215 [Polyangiaceae bacterium]
MNFYGHAVLAAATGGDSAFVLGAMLPDFISILGTRPPRLELGSLALGVAFHHRTDAAFHDSTTFRALQGHASSYLTARGVRRGPTRAVAHVGVELLIDAALAAQNQHSVQLGTKTADERYLAALELGESRQVRLAWELPAQTERFVELCRRLRHAGVDRFRVGAEQAMKDLARILARRPRLALQEAETRVVQEWATEAFVVVKSELLVLLQELENRLRGRVD